MLILSSAIMVNYCFFVNENKNIETIYANTIDEDESNIVQPVVDGKAENSIASGNYTNNMILVNFLGEDNFQELNLYKSSYETFDYMFNTSDTSVKTYYNLNSNGNINLNTDIITDDGVEAKLYTINKPRTYFMPYVILDDGEYVINEDGYFDYYLVESYSDNPLALNSLSPYFFMNCELIANVYKIPSGSNLTKDNDYSDKIMSYNEALLLSLINPNYHLVESNQRYYKEYQLMCNIYDMAKNDMDLISSDNNSDNNIDIFSVALIDDERTSKYKMSNGYYWSTLLWPHKTNLNFVQNNFKWALNSSNLNEFVKYFNNLGYEIDDATSIVNYLYNKPQRDNLSFNTINLTKYEMYDLSKWNKWEFFVKDITTICHELGHVFGLPDLYVYNNANDSYMVNSWSQMCSNPFNPSFFTSYERLKLGWLKEGVNVIDITTNGEYNLNFVKGNDENNIVAYRVKIDSSNYVYFEYRNPFYQYFDKSCGNPGLLVYSVNVSVSDGNKNGAPFAVYVQKASEDTNILYAALDVGQSMGNSNKSSKDGAILIYNETSNEKNTGIVVTVTNKTDDTLSFTISSEDLLQEVNKYTLADFDNNKTLYDKLLSQVEEDYLYIDSFVAKDTLNINDCNLTDLDFLQLFNLQDVKNINLADNYLELSETEVNNILSKYNLNNICLSGNYIDLYSISKSLLQNPVITWGIQYTSYSTIFLNQQVQFSYYLKDTDVIEIEFDYNTFSLCDNGIVGIYEPSQYGTKILKQIYKDNSPYEAKTKSKIYTLILVYSDYNDYDNALRIKLKSKFPDLNALIYVNGIDKTNLIFEYNLPSTSVIGSGYIEITIKYNSIELGTYNLYYKIVEGIKIDFTNGQTVYISKYDNFDNNKYLYDVVFVEDGVSVDLKYSNSGESKTYFTTFYYGQLNGDGSVNITSEVSAIDTSQIETYIIKYSVIDSYGDLSYFYRQVTITDKLLLKENFDETLYDVLLKLKQAQSIFIDDFVDFEYIDLSNNNLTSIKGLSQLNFKQNVIINLSINNLLEISEISSFLNVAEEVSQIILIFNNFISLNIENISSDIRNKCVFAVQNLTKTNISTVNENTKIADIYNDFSNILSFDDKNYEILNNQLYLKIYGQDIKCEFVLEFNNSKIAVNIDNILVNLKNTTIIKEYNENYMFNLEDVLIVDGCGYNHINVNTNLEDLNLNIIGNKIVNIEVQYENLTADLQYTISVVDTTNPVIDLNGDTKVYVLSVQDYINKYRNDLYSAYDDYDGTLNVDVNEPIMQGYGVYEVIYSAVDSSENRAQLVRTVYIGNAFLVSNEINVEYNTTFFLDFNFVVFDISDFEIYYKYTNDENYMLYSLSEGIKISQFGSHSLDIKLLSIYNEDLTITLNLIAVIEDNLAPVITLLGDFYTEIYAGSQYLEVGYYVSDNSTDKILNYGQNLDEIKVAISYTYISSSGSESLVSYLDTTKVGTYIISYKAFDAYNNSAFVNRTVEVVYYPIDNIRIDNTTLLNRYSTGKVIQFKLITDCEYIVDPNPLVIWYVNGVEYKREYGMSTNIKFDKAGEYVISAQIDGNDNAQSTNVEIQIYKQSQYDNIFLYIGIGLGLTVILCFVIYFVNVYRKRNFY